MSRVFVVQDQRRVDRRSGELVPRFDSMLRLAAEYGEVRYLLSPSARPWNIESILRDLRRGLADYGPGDSLLLIGNPVLIGLAVATAALRTGAVRMLQYTSGSRERPVEHYIPVDAQVFERDDGTEVG